MTILRAITFPKTELLIKTYYNVLLYFQFQMHQNTMEFPHQPENIKIVQQLDSIVPVDVEFNKTYDILKPLSVTDMSVLNRTSRNFPVEYVKLSSRDPHIVLANGSDEQAPEGKSFDKIVKYQEDKEDIELLNISEILTVKYLYRSCDFSQSCKNRNGMGN